MKAVLHWVAVLLSLSGAFMARGAVWPVVTDGQAVGAHYIGASWQAEEGRLVGVGDTSRLYSDRALGAGDFRITARLVLPAMTQQAPEIGIGPYSYFQFDANGGRFIIGGPLLVPDEQMIRYTIVGRNPRTLQRGSRLCLRRSGAAARSNS